MSSIKPASRILPIGLLCVAAASCEFRTPVAPPPTGEIQLVTSVSGAGIDADRVSVDMQAQSVEWPFRGWGGSAVGIRTVLTVRVITGSYRVWASIRPDDYTRLGYRHHCPTSTSGDTVSVAEGQRIVVERAFVCASPGGAQVRTSVTGVDPDVKLRVQLAEAPGICNMELSEDPYWLYYYMHWVFLVDQIGSIRHGPMWPGSYRMNLCGLPPSCRTSASSQAFVVKEDELTDVLFAIRCEGGPDPS